MSDGWRKFFSFVLGFVFTVAFILFVLGLVVRRDLLAPDLYTQALSENDVYDRIYTELLADPAVQEAFKDATGVQIDLITEELYAQIVGGLYLIVPPSQMEAGADRFFTQMTSYLRGDTDQLPENLDLGQAVTPEALADNIARAATTVAVASIDRATPIVLEKTAPIVEDEIVDYLDNISRGILGPLPGRLFRMTVSGMTTAASEQLTTLLLGPAAATTSDETRTQIEGALAADDLVEAVSLAATERLTLLVTERIAANEARLAETQALIGISGAAQALGQTRDQVVGGLNQARSYMILLGQLLWPLAIVMLICIVLIVWLNNDSLADMLQSVGWTLVISSGLVMVVWLIVRFVAESRLSTALAATAVGPASLDGIIDDVVASLLNGVWGSVWTMALPFMIGGLIALAFGYSKELLRFLSNLLEPIWDYKWTVLAALFGLLVVAPLLWGLLTSDSRAANQPCNGHVELCDRPVNEVAYASSHNSMSIAEYGWVWPMHDGTITDQLNAGVRALLVDSHYITDNEGEPEFMATLPPGAITFINTAVDNFTPPAQEGLWLCHQFCALGYSPFDDMLVEVRTFLEENPREVLFMVIQDAVTPEDTEEAFVAAGLEPYIYDHPTDAAWPTLRTLIDSNERLIVLAEEEGPPPSWYGNVWDVTEETPYTFIFTEDFNCNVNRGDTGKPFFLLNHWIQRGAPNRVDGAIVNEYDFLLARAQQCAVERGQMPNFIAVNWYRQGDLFDVVDTLNGVYAPSE